MKKKTLIVNDVEITVVRKGVKNINLAIYPPDAEVRVSAPRHFSDELICSVIMSRLGWIRKKRAALLARPVQPSLQMVSGEMHLVFGQQYQLQVVERNGRAGVIISDDFQLLLHVRKDTEKEQRAAILCEWYRQQLAARIPDLLKRWQSVIGVEANEWRIRRMKTRWGTCNITDKRIWLNLELARMSPVCLEYVLVHELVHLLERYHNARFWAFMDSFLPGWRAVRAELKRQTMFEH